MAEPPRTPLTPLTPPDPPEPFKTWRGTVLIAVAATAFAAVLALVMYRWYELQTFSDALRFEGYHRFSGSLLEPLPVAGSDLIKLRVLSDDGGELVLPPMADVEPARGKPLTIYKPGTCVEGWARHHRGYLVEVGLRIEGLDYYFEGDSGWIVRNADASEMP